MAEIRLQVPDGNTCDGCDHWDFDNMDRTVCTAFHKMLSKGITITPHPDCIAARVKPIVLRVHLHKYDGLVWWYSASIGDTVIENSAARATTYASKSKAKRGAERWAAKTFPGYDVRIEWGD